jgi:hypothetical protein
MYPIKVVSHRLSSTFKKRRKFRKVQVVRVEGVERKREGKKDYE